MKHARHRIRPAHALAVLLIAHALPGCLQTPPTSSWATDVFHIRLAALKPAMSTAEVLTAMGARRDPRVSGHTVTYDLTEGYSLTLFLDDTNTHPQEVVLHTPYENVATHWGRQLTDAELAIGAPTTRPAR